MTDLTPEIWTNLTGRFLATLTREPDTFNSEDRLFIRNHRRERVDRLTLFAEKSSSSAISPIQFLFESARKWAEAINLEIDLVETGSLGLISESPVIGVQIPGRSRLLYGQVIPEDIPLILQSVQRHVPITQNLLGQLVLHGQQPWEHITRIEDHPFFSGQVRHLLHLSGLIDPGSIHDFFAWGGYRAFAKCIRFYTDREIIRIIELSELRGRSGSGFPAHVKWNKVMSEYADRRFVICNADESDPGAYMHRLLLESNPHSVLEGIMIAAYTVGASQAFIYTRSRYRLVVERLQSAIAQARKAGMLGPDILGSGYSLEIQLRRAPGAYVCGEETALIASIEGNRGMPKTKPPYPVSNGLFGKPTLVQNIETLAQVPLILNRGPEWYKKTGTDGSRGTKLFSLAGKVSRLGVLEVPFGTTIQEMVEGMGGGARGGTSIKAVLAGGPAGKYLPPAKLNLPVDFDRFQADGLVLGSGSLIVLSNADCIVAMTRHLVEFMSQESCGKCIPCREGTKRMLEVFKLLTERFDPESKYLALDRFKGVTQLEELSRVMQDTSLCGLGRSAPNTVLSLLEHFRGELEEHVFDRKCATQVCRKLLHYTIDPVECTGCHLCFQKCPAQAIVGSPRQIHFIMSDPCTGCGICAEVCKFSAIKVS